jgi:hypothetical protein
LLRYEKNLLKIYSQNFSPICLDSFLRRREKPLMWLIICLLLLHATLCWLNSLRSKTMSCVHAVKIVIYSHLSVWASWASSLIVLHVLLQRILNWRISYFFSIVHTFILEYYWTSNIRIYELRRIIFTWSSIVCILLLNNFLTLLLQSLLQILADHDKIWCSFLFTFISLLRIHLSWVLIILDIHDRLRWLDNLSIVKCFKHSSKM